MALRHQHRRLLPINGVWARITASTPRTSVTSGPYGARGAEAADWMVGPPVRGPGDAAGGVQPDAGADAGAGVYAWLAALELDEFDEQLE